MKGERKAEREWGGENIGGNCAIVVINWCERKLIDDEVVTRK